MVVTVRVSAILCLLFLSWMFGFCEMFIVDTFVATVLYVQRELIEVQLASSSSQAPDGSIDSFSFSIAFASLTFSAEMCWRKYVREKHFC